MRFESRTGQQITSLNDWERLASPAAAHHWKPHRSAYELAADWIERDAAARVTALLRLRPELANPTLRVGVAEKKTQFDGNPRGPRNHDLLVTAETDGGALVIGVEGKADEPFDRTLVAWRAAALAGSPQSGAPARLDALTTSFFATTLADDTGQPPLAGLGYQLLSGLAGTLADAQHLAAPRAVLLVHEFVTDLTDDARHRTNAQALDDFLVRLAGSDLHRDGDRDAWITAPVSVRGDGVRRPATLPVHIAKLTTRTR